jgi:hypothetical protein
MWNLKVDAKGQCGTKRRARACADDTCKCHGNITLRHSGGEQGESVQKEEM